MKRNDSYFQGGSESLCSEVLFFFFNILFIIFKDFIYLFSERGRGRERKEEKH